MNILLHILLLSLALYGSKVTWQEGMIFEKPKLWLDEFWGDWLIRKPLYACPACMPSIWGSVYYWIAAVDKIGPTEFFYWPVFVLATCGVTWVLMYQFPFDD